MGARTPNLQLRGGTYRLRVRVPDALRDAVGKTEVLRSLGTGDYRRASQLARIERAKLDAEWDALRRSLKPQKAAPLSEHDILHLVTRWFVSSDRSLSENGQGDYSSDSETYAEAMSDLANTMSWDMIGGHLYRTAQHLLANSHLAAADTDPLFLKLQTTLQQAMVEIERRRIIRRFPNAHVPLDPFFQTVDRQASVKPVAKSLGTLIREFQADPARLPSLGKTLLKHKAQWRMLEAFFGADTPVTSITRDEVRRFMSFLKSYPSNASKHFPNMAPLDIPALARAKKLPTMSVDTANAYLRQLSVLTRYALHEGIILSDPAIGLQLKPVKAVAAKDRRFPFSDEDLQRIFSAPLFRGCIDDTRNYAAPGPNILRRARFWIPLISLFTGMRLGEICQLTLDDFVVDEDVDIILIRSNDEGDDVKRVKTAAGHRFVPIHPELRALQRFPISLRHRQRL